MRSFGAPVIEPGGKQARTHSAGADLLAQPPAHAGDELVHGLVGLDPHQLGHLDAADLADAAEVVAQQVDDRHVLGPALLVGAQRRGEARVLVRGRAAAAGALDRPRFRPALAVDREEALRRGAQHGEVAEAQVGGEGRRIGPAQGAVELERIRRASAMTLLVRQIS